MIGPIHENVGKVKIGQRRCRKLFVVFFFHLISTDPLLFYFQWPVSIFNVEPIVLLLLMTEYDFRKKSGTSQCSTSVMSRKAFVCVGHSFRHQGRCKKHIPNQKEGGQRWKSGCALRSFRGIHENNINTLFFFVFLFLLFFIIIIF